MQITPTQFTPKLREILQHWGDPLVLIERNNCGAQVVDNLRKDFNYENIVNWGTNRISNRNSATLGMVAHTTTKFYAVSNQRYWLNTMKQVHLNDISTVSELKDFVRGRNSTWGAKHGSNDDKVMALVWALMILHEDIIGLYFDIIDRDENGRASAIRSMDYGIKNFINPTSIYTNERNGLAREALPILMGGSAASENPDLDELEAQGWTLL